MLGTFDAAPVIPNPAVAVIKTPVIDDGVLILSWTGPGRLQESADLLVWSDVPGNPVTPFIGPAPVGGRRFYRVLME